MFLLCLPIIQSALFCMTVGLDPKGLKVAVVNKEFSLLNVTSCPVMKYNTCTEYLLSCSYFDFLTNQKDMILVSRQYFFHLGNFAIFIINQC